MALLSSSGQVDRPLQNKKIVERLHQPMGVMIIRRNTTIAPVSERHYYRRSNGKRIIIKELKFNQLMLK
jgi:hypothetical protein